MNLDSKSFGSEGVTLPDQQYNGSRFSEIWAALLANPYYAAPNVAEVAIVRLAWLANFTRQQTRIIKRPLACPMPPSPPAPPAIVVMLGLLVEFVTTSPWAPPPPPPPYCW